MSQRRQSRDDNFGAMVSSISDSGATRLFRIRRGAQENMSNGQIRTDERFSPRQLEWNDSPDRVRITHT